MLLEQLNPNKFETISKDALKNVNGGESGGGSMTLKTESRIITVTDGKDTVILKQYRDLVMTYKSDDDFGCYYGTTEEWGNWEMR